MHNKNDDLNFKFKNDPNPSRYTWRQKFLTILKYYR